MDDFTNVTNKQQTIHDLGFNISSPRERLRSIDGIKEYGDIKIGTKVLKDATLDIGTLSHVHRQFANKHFILKAIAERNYSVMREISNYFYNTNGIYSRICDYYAGLFRYDWYITPEIQEEITDKLSEKVMKDFNELLTYLDNSHIKKICGDIALKVVIDGAYYGYLSDDTSGVILQELPINYCRTRFKVGNSPVIEFNMRFFDEKFKDINYRMKVLKMFPKEFQKGYVLYKAGKLTPEVLGDDPAWRSTIGWQERDVQCGCFASGWYPLEPGAAIKFSLSHGDQPLFINAIPTLIDLDTAQDLDRRKQMQQLQKIIIQKLPLDKNGDLIFDVEEARDIHNNAIEMLQHSIGTDVLTTFADVSVEDIADSSSDSSANDVLERMERAAYNAFGISRNLFNTDGNLSLEKSIQDDEAIMRSLIYQYAMFFNHIVQKKGPSKKKYSFRFFMLETTTNNYKELSKLYKEQTQIGYSKMLPQIALGHSQSSIIHTAFFENEVLKLSQIMIPPLMSSTMNAESLASIKDGGSVSQAIEKATKEKESGRPELPDDQKSEKTIQNKESMG